MMKNTETQTTEVKTMTRFFCGGLYGNNPDTKVFGMVRSTGSPFPYVCDNRQQAEKLFGMTRHHSALYELGNDNTGIAYRVGSGFEFTDAPETVQLTSEQVRQIENAPIWAI